MKALLSGLQGDDEKKYHLQSYGLRLTNLPFKPTTGEIIYVENEYNEKINLLIKRNRSFIQKCLDRSTIFKSKFIYLPELFDDLSHDEQVIGYFAPYLSNQSLSSDTSIKSSLLLDYMLVPENRKNITTCFARYRGEDSKGSLFECVGFDPEDGINDKKFFELLCSLFDHYPQVPETVYSIHYLEVFTEADDFFDKESKQLIKEVKERISQLRKLGVSQWALEQLVKPEIKLSKLVVTNDHQIFLPDYNGIEIKMEPLVKAVFLLFLKHPEGILFKCLPDYREELTDIYAKLKVFGLTGKVLKSIADVTNPLCNSINEKCARIRSAFIKEFDESLAKYYFVTGERGEAKKILLPSDLVVWE